MNAQPDKKQRKFAVETQMTARDDFKPCTRRQALAAIGAATLAMLAPAASAQTAAQAAGILKQADKLTWIAEGGGKRAVYIFFDPNCPFCHHLYGKLRPMVGKNDLQFRWVPLGMLTASSLPKAAAIVQATDPLAAFRKNEDDYDFAANGQPGGGILPATTITPKARKELDANRAVYNSQKLFGVPVMLWHSADDQAHMVVGVPGDEELQKILKSVR